MTIFLHILTDFFTNLGNNPFSFSNTSLKFFCNPSAAPLCAQTAIRRRLFLRFMKKDCKRKKFYHFRQKTGNNFPNITFQKMQSKDDNLKKRNLTRAGIFEPDCLIFICIKDKMKKLQFFHTYCNW